MKLVSVLFVFLFSFSLIAQTPLEKGTISLNGSLSYSSQSYDGSDDSRNILMLNPQAGYFIAENFSLGLSLSYINYSLGSASSTEWGIGPSLRYYFPTEKVKPFFSLGYGYTKSSNSSNDDKWVGTQFIITAGLDYFIVKNVALETIASYSFNNEKLPDSYKSFYRNMDQKSKTFMIGIGLNYFIY